VSLVEFLFLLFEFIVSFFSRKTSLMNILAARFPSGGTNMSKLQGSITVNGKPREEEKFRKISAYVLQVSPCSNCCC
jgi:ABC-type multidrug transport system ATPase subunit